MAKTTRGVSGVRTRLRPRPARSFLDLFEDRCRGTPDAVALVDPGDAGAHLTYRGLDRRADRLALDLRELGVGCEVSVGVLLERSVDLIVAILGILKAGGTYVPLETDLPPRRLAFLLRDSGLPVLVAHGHLLEGVAVPSGICVMRLTGDHGPADHEGSATPARIEMPPEGGAYVVYTSGSTGRPKGVLIENRSLSWFAKAAIEHYAIQPGDRILQFSSLSFDISVEEIFPCLAGGATLVLRDRAMARSVEEFWQRCCEWSATALFLPTAFWQELAAAWADAPTIDPQALRLISFGGEQVLPRRIADWRRAVARHRGLARVRLMNGYGPTETTVVATLHELTAGDEEPRLGEGESRIGRAIGGAKVRVVDSQLRETAPGEVGELAIGGAGVARGYLGRRAATAARFVPDPFSDLPGDRLYLSGDRVRRSPGGELVFLGRFDRQVKIRGFRVELGEIEAVMARHPQVAAAAVVVAGRGAARRTSSSRLVGYYVPAAGIRPSASKARIGSGLRDLLRRHLPSYMVPATLVSLTALPINPHGKIDRQRLSRMAVPEDDAGALRHGHEAPRSEVERTLAAIWAETLRLPRVGIHDNFLELGGDSILAIQIVARAHREGLRLTSRELFRLQTIARLAEAPGAVGRPSGGRTAPAPAPPSDPVTGPVPLTPIERWFFEADLPAPWHFNQSVLLAVRGTVELEVLRQAVARLLEHHDALRLRFTRSETGWEQHCAAAAGAVPFCAFDLSALREPDRRAALERATGDLHASLDLERGPLIRVAYFDLGRQGGRRARGRLFVAIHHVAVDTVSWRILLADLESACRRLGRRLPARLPPKTTSYREWAERLRAYARAGLPRRERDFWLASAPPAAPLPVDKRGADAADPENTRASEERVSTSLDRRRTRELLRRVPAAYRTRIEDVLLTALTLAMGPWAGRRSILVELEGHGREEILEGVDLSRTVGWFTSTYPVFLSLDGGIGPGDALKAVKEQLRAIPGRGMGYYLLRYLSTDPEVARRLRSWPQPEVSFNYLGQVDAWFSGSSTFAPAAEATGPRRSPAAPRGYLLEIEGYVAGERLSIHWTYSRNLYRRATVEKLARAFMDALEALVAHCLAPQAGGYTPSDFPLARLDQTDLDRLVASERGIEDVYPLTHMQQGMLFHALYAPRSAVYFEQSSWTLAGDLDVSAFRAAWGRLVERHPVLRTSFAWQGLARPLQIVRRRVDLPWRQLDGRADGGSQAERSARLEALLAADRREGFDLATAPLFRLILVRLEEGSYRFVWSVHHMLLDGWSISLLFDELFDFYRAFHRGRPAERPLPPPFSRYVEWLAGRDSAAAEAFWRRTLAGFTTPTPLAIERSRADTGGSSESERRRLSAAVSDDLYSLARRHRLTIATMIQGAWAVWLSRTSGRRDVVFGTTISGRPESLPGADAIVGLLINMLPVRVRVAPREPWLEWLDRLQKQTLELRDFGHSPLSEIQKWSEVPGQLFASILGFHNYPGEASLRERSSPLELGDLRYFSQTHYPLVIEVVLEQRLTLQARYDPGRFDRPAIRRALGQLARLLAGMAGGGTRRLADLPLLGPAERHQLLVEWCAPPGGGRPLPAVHQLFEARVEGGGDAVALVWSGAAGNEHNLSYRQLNRRANSLAGRLRRRGVGPGALAGIFLERSPEMVVAVLAVLKTGAAYLPLPLDDPAPRRAAILEEAAVSVVLTRRRLLAGLAAVPRDAPRLVLGDGAPAARRDGEENPGVECDPESAAYVLFTSGTTGRPKGVVVSHRGLASYLSWAVEAYRVARGGGAPLHSSIAFDLTVTSLFAPLLAGRSVELLPEERDAAALAASLERRPGVSFVKLTPTHGQMLLHQLAGDGREAPAGVGAVILGGETLHREHAAAWRRVAPRARLINEYGPTEATVGCAVHELPPLPGPPAPGQAVPIGRPIERTRLYLVDRELSPVPSGVPGELCVGGAQLARGYLGRPARTAESFVPDPFAARPGERIYRTGDLARHLAGGELELLGRIDHQVKVRGFRVEPQEIEAVLLRHPGVSEAVVVARPAAAGARGGRLVAYVVAGGDDPGAGRRGEDAGAGGLFEIGTAAAGGRDRRRIARLRDHLRSRLPDYMVPSALVMLDAMPLAASGKVDRRALPPPESARPAPEETFVAPRTPAERDLAAIWREALGLEEVGVHDDFFALGGDSILSIQIVAGAGERGWRFTPRDLFRLRTVARLAAHAAASGERRRPPPAAEQGIVRGEVPLTPIQSWFFERQLPDPAHFNWSALFEPRRPLPAAVLEGALAAVLRHHDALRSRFVRTAGGWRQRIEDAGGEVPFSTVDLSRLAAAPAAAAGAAAAAALQRGLDLAAGPLLRLVRFDPGGGRRQRLLVVIHHLVVDGVSWRVLLEDLERACRRLAAGRAVELPPKTASFAAWARLLEEQARSAGTRAELASWLAVPGGPRLPLDHAAGGSAAARNTMASAAKVTVALGAAATRRLLREVPAAYRIRVHDLLLTALARTLAAWTRRDRLAVDLEGHGREELGAAAGSRPLDVSRTVGWFATIFPVLLDLAGCAEPDAALKAVKEQVAGVPRRGIGYGLLRYLGRAADAARLRARAAPEVAFDYLGTLDAPLAAGSRLRQVEDFDPPVESRRGRRSHLLEIHGGVVAGRLRLEWTYSENLHRRATVRALARACRRQVEALIDHCLSPAAIGCTPSDFPLAGLDQGRLDRLLAAVGVPEDVYPLTPMQQGMLFHARLSPGSTVYFEQISWDLRPGLDVGAFRRAWEVLLERHAVLRTAFVWEGLPRPLQIVHRQVELPWEERDGRSGAGGADAGSAEARLRAFLAADRRRGFDLTRAPLMRLTLLRLGGGRRRGEGRIRFVWSSHHLLLDGWSTPVILEELEVLYRCLRSGAPDGLAPPRPYRDLVAWLAARDPAPAEGFWRRALAGFSAPTALAPMGVAGARPWGGTASSPAAGEPVGPSTEPVERELWLSPEATARLEAFARRQRLTLGTLAQGAWAMLLAAYGGTGDVLFGVTVSGRPPSLPGSQSMVGLFVNTLPLRAKVTAEPLVVWLRRLQAAAAEMRQHEHSPLVDVQGWSEVPPPRPLFDHLLVFESYPQRGQREVLSAGDREAFSHTHYPLTVFVRPGRRLGLQMSFDPGYFSSAAVWGLLRRFRRILTALEEHAARAATRVPLLDAAELHQQQIEWNACAPPPAPPTPLVELFERQVRRVPEALAVVAGGRRPARGLSYRELDRRADRLASRLRAEAVGPGDVVAVALGRTLEMAVSMLAVFKAGAACLPLDRSHPDARLALLIEDAGARVLLADRAAAFAAAGGGVVRVDPGAEPSGPVAEAGARPRWDDEDLAYVIYTSGSTGRPKGVAMRHGALRQLVAWHLRHPDLAAARRTLQFAAPSFDVSLQEIFSTWCTGGTLVLVEDEVRRDAEALDRFLATAAVERCFLPPVALQQLAEVGVQARGRPLELIAAGEQLRISGALADWLATAAGSALHNHYGPSETHVVTAWQLAGPPAEAPPLPPIGRPLTGSRALLLDAGLRPLPAGVAGELHLGGDCLARGYLRRPARTAESFVPDPFRRRPGARLYRTGDLARFLPDGRLEFLGRLDQQVKIRGFRVEPGEIESVLMEHPAVAEAVVLARPAPAGPRLEAHAVVAAPERRLVDDLRRHLEARLPAFMVPAAFHLAAALPRTPHGKVDREALARAAPDRGALPPSAVPPRSPIEAILEEIWSRVLGLDGVGVHDSFFELGGHSLLVTRVLSRVRRTLGVELPMRSLFDHPTVAALAAELAPALAAARGTRGAAGRVPLCRRRDPRQPVPLSFAQRRLWFVHQLDPASTAYVLADAFRLQGRLQVAALEAAFRELGRRHEVLRTTFSRTPAGEAPGRRRSAVQVIAPGVALELPVVDLSRLPGPVRRDVAERLARDQNALAFDLARGPLVRLLLVRLGRRRHRLLVHQHHIISDGWSRSIFFRELAVLYAAFSAGRPSPLAELPIQYADYALWQRRRLSDDALADSLAYWRRRLADLTPLRLAGDRAPRPGRRQEIHRAGSVAFELPAGVAAALERAGLDAGASLFMTTLAAYLALLGRHTQQRDLTVGTPIAGRGREEIEGLLGFFVNLLALRVDVDQSASFADLLRRVRSAALEAFAYQELPFEKLVESLDPDRSGGLQPLFQATFSLQQAPDPAVELDGLEVRPIDVDPPRSRFDLELHLWRQAGRLSATFDYRGELFDAATITRLARQFARLAGAAAAAPERRLAELPLLGPAERHQLLAEWNDSRAPYPRDLSLPQLFAARVAAAPDAVAVVCEDFAGAARQLSYRELDRRARRLARRLAALGVGPESAVGLCLERSEELVISLLAVMAAGGFYVPLDPAAPAERLGLIAGSAGIRVLVTRRTLAGRLPAVPGAVPLFLDDPAAGGGAAAAGPAGHPQALAYVMYTSGSTGRPKGVAVPQRAVARLVLGSDYVRLGPSDRVAQVANAAFDAATFEIWGPLLAGAGVVILPRQTAVAPRRLAAALRRQRVSTLFLTTALFHLVVAEDAGAFGPLRHLLFGGEAVDPERVRACLEGAAPRRLLHVYGPTESTTFATWHRVRKVAPGSATVAIGMPIANTTAHVVDPRLRPAALGVPGELAIGGDGLARGYQGGAAETAARFVPDPFAREPGARLYLSGDRVRRSGGGEVSFLGRLDHQVKVRGFRIELGEVETVLARHPEVREAAVVLREGAGGDGRRLAAFAVLGSPAADPAAAAGRLRDHLAARLPEYMVPASLVVTDRLPLTATAKVDRLALARRASAETPRPRLATAFARPRTPTQEVLAAIWSRLLEVDAVGVDDDFFELGGHSLLATRVVSQIDRSFEVELPLAAFFERPTVAGLAEVLDGTGAGGAAGGPELRRRPGADRPLSFAQERLWFLHRMEPSSAAYNLPLAWRLEGALDVAALIAACREVARRHEVLRTVFPDSGGRPRQVVAPGPGVRAALVDLRALAAGDREARARRIARRQAARPFDLGRGPLFRVTLLRLAARCHVLLLDLHHIVSDGWSLDVLARELGRAYDAFSRRRPSPLAPLAVQYADFAAWERERLAGDALAAQLAWWRDLLAGSEPLDLPADRPRPRYQTFDAASRGFALDAGATRALQDLGLAAGATLFMTTLAAFSALIRHWTRRVDVVVGSPIAGRRHHGVEDLIGFFVNMLPLRLDLSGNPSWSELQRRVRRAALDAYAHQDVPFAKLVEALEPERDTGRNPLFGVSFALHNAPAAPLELTGLGVSEVELDPATVRFDLEVQLWEDGGRLSGCFVYNTDLFDATTIERAVRRYRTLLAGLAADPDRRLDALVRQPPAERHQLLVEWNDRETPRRGRRALHRRFAAQAARTPEAVAVIRDRRGGGGEHLSYRELSHRAGRLARRLRALGVGPETPVGICLDRGPELVIGLLGILRAGGAYLPLDPSYPPRRLALMLEDSGVSVLLTRARWAPALAGFRGRVLLLEPGGMPAAPADGGPLPQVRPQNPAYLLYTSGSTGMPKGVVISHAAIVHHMDWMQAALPIDARDRVVQKTPISFDASVWEFWAPLLVGGGLIMARPGAERDGADLAATVRRQRASVLQVVPHQLRLLLDAGEGFAGCRHLRRVYCGGETLDAELRERFHRRGPAAELLNVYGPTEATIHATFDRCRAGDPQASAPIGRPIANARAMLVDDSLRPVPLGAPGRLLVSGAGLARGYLGRPGRTAERFGPDPSAALPGARLYDTGDLARHLPDGRLLFAGRADHQLKLRGVRVELGEIESVLGRHPAVRRAAAAVAERGPGDRRLVAFYVGAAGGGDGIRAFLRRRLPPATVPSLLLRLPALPRSPSGKIDRPRLARAAREAVGGGGRKELDALGAVPAGGAGVRRGVPRTPQEQVLLEIWSRVLGIGIRGLGIHDHFFELGGHSLLATQVVSRIRRTLGAEVPLRAVFEHPTVAGLAAELARAGGDPPAGPEAAAGGSGERPLSFAQERLWFLHQLEPESSAYHVATALRLSGRLDAVTLEAALGEIVRRHEALRTTFPSRGGRPRQTVSPASTRRLPVVDLRAVAADGAGLPAAAREILRRETERPFDLERGPLLRPLLLRLGADDHVLFLAVHHIVFDGWSQGVLEGELAALYSAFSRREPSPLPPLAIQYADFAAWQRRWLDGEPLAARLAYWRRQLAGLEQLRLPTDRPRPSFQTHRAGCRSLTLGAGLSSSLRTLSLEAGVSLYMTLLAAFLTLLHRYSGGRDIAVGSPIANRNFEEIEGLVGFFVNMLVMRGDLSSRRGELDFRTLLRRVRDVALDAYAHQDLPFERLVEDLEPVRDMSQHPLFQVTLALQNAPPAAGEMPGLTVRPLELEVRAVRFDLELYLWEDEAIELTLVYNADLFDGATAARMASHFAGLLRGAVAAPRSPIAHLPMQRPGERHQLLVEWSGAAPAGGGEELAHELFERWAARTPEAPAVITEATLSPRDFGSPHHRIGYYQLTYRDLNRRANRLARHLRALGSWAAAGPEVRVGVYLERTPEAIISVLGILKAGGVYVPVDAAYGRERLRFQLRDAGAPILVTRRRLLAELPAGLRPRGVEVVCLDGDWSRISRRRGDDLRRRPRDAAALANVTYTSGSTGAPKGVMVTHRGLVDACRVWQRTYRLRRGDRHLQMASLSFDQFSGDWIRALGSGGVLVLCPRELLVAPAELYALMRRHRVDLGDFVPAVATQLARHLEDCPGRPLDFLRILVVGADTWYLEEQRALARLVGARTRLINAYGVTEASVDSTYFEGAAAGLAGGRAVPVGRPFAGTRLHVLDRRLEPVPAGAPGELHLAGARLARGYLGRPALTAEKFVPAPFVVAGGEAGERLYRTGDLVRHLPDGNLEILGRLDRQVKIRGFRIEPGEIEAVLARHPQVAEAAVVAVPGGDRAEGTARLVAFLVRRIEPADPVEASWQRRQVAQWRAVHEEEGRGGAAAADPELDFAGWISSYTGRPIPEAEMREWVERTAERILASCRGSGGSGTLGRVLEIGCGSGLLLLRLARHADSYLGTDFSRPALAALGETIRRRRLPRVRLERREAADLSDLGAGGFDIILLNSVAQYFPSVDYLLRVLRGAAVAAAPGGRIFVGDVRHLGLHQAYCAAVELHSADPATPLAELAERARRRRLREEELLIDPDLFPALQRQLPRVSEVRILPKLGRSHNELTKFRYDVILRLDGGAADSAGEADGSAAGAAGLGSGAAWLDWVSSRLSLDAVRRHLARGRPDALVLTGVPNPRLALEVELAERLRSGAAGTVGDLERVRAAGPSGAASRARGAEPDDLEALAAELGYSLELSWGNGGADGRYDAIFERPPAGGPARRREDLSGLLRDEPKTTRPWPSYGNDPLREAAERHLAPRLAAFLGERLPGYMVPSAFVLLDALPLLPSGKVDRGALARAAPRRASPARAGAAPAPRTPVEAAVAEIFGRLLGAEQVGRGDGFFDLGGHSLLAVRLMAAIEARFGVRLPLSTMFREPTVRGLAATIERGAPRGHGSPLVRIRGAAGRSAGAGPPPLYGVHPIGGHVLCYADLARHLDGGRPFFGLQARGHDGRQPFLQDVESMAEHYLAAIAAVQPAGPFLLCGWSMGGLVAYEMARRLAGRGERVELLALVDCGVPEAGDGAGEAGDGDLRLFAADLGLAADLLPASAGGGLDQVLETARRTGAVAEDAGRERLRHLYRLFESNGRAMRRYRPRPYDGKITLFRPAAAAAGDPTLGWGALAREVEVRGVPGDHFTMVREPHVRVLAAELERALRSASTSTAPAGRPRS